MATTSTVTEVPPRRGRRSSRAEPRLQRWFPLVALLLMHPRTASAQTDPKGNAASSEASGWWVGAVLQSDVGLLPGGDVCGRRAQSRGSYSCFRPDREQYLGVPVSGEPAAVMPALGTMRIALHAEHAIFGNFTAGGRIGFAFGGGPTPSKGPPFLPLHLEARVAYWIGKKLSPAPGLRGFVTLAGGVAQLDASREVDVTECRSGDASGCTPANNVQPGGPNPDRQTLVAYKKAGIGFIGLGAGLHYSFVRGSGGVFEIKATQHFPSYGFAISPAISYVFHVL